MTAAELLELTRAGFALTRLLLTAAENHPTVTDEELDQLRAEHRDLVARLEAETEVPDPR